MWKGKSMPKAVWNGATLDESEDTVVVEGNHYFPPDALNREYFVENSHHTVCEIMGLSGRDTVLRDWPPQ